MGIKIKNEAGFSAFEAVLVLLIILLIGVVGYMVYKGQPKTATTTGAVASTKALSPAPAKPAYFDFKELSVKFIPDKSLAGLSYSLIPGYSGPGEGVYVTDSAVQAAFSQCQGDSGGNAVPADQVAESSSFAGLSRAPGSYAQSGGGEAVLVKQFNGFYITLSYPNGNNCAGQSQQDNANYQQVNQAAGKALLTSLKATITKD
ncbi:MAG TPA: hypothetical protein VFN51_03315 [Candidatus Saccharimonadales bacterium]|nr:hypothetical protein [Candidatus Saccharimonadales bacterium]